MIATLRPLRRWGVALLLLAIPAQPAIAQGQGVNGYPNAEKRIGLAGGDTVTLLNRFMQDNGPAMRTPGRRLDLQYSTVIPRSDSLGRLAQADRAAQFFGAQAIELGVHKLSIGICDTRECAERRHPPAVWYLYERTSTGWKRAP